MQILCAIGIRGGADLVRRTAERIQGDGEWLLLHVIDTGPRHALERFGPAHRPPPPQPPRGLRTPALPGPLEGMLNRAEEQGGEEALKEALDAAEALNLQATTRLERGDPNQMIIQIAQRDEFDLIAIGARERGGPPHEGPGFIGHTARFVLDHAPCDVPLLRGMNISSAQGGAGAHGA